MKAPDCHEQINCKKYSYCYNVAHNCNTRCTWNKYWHTEARSMNSKPGQFFMELNSENSQIWVWGYN